MVKLIPEQMKHNGRGYNEKKNDKTVWRTSPEPTQHTIVCFYEKANHESRKPNWPRIEQNCKTHVDDNKWWEEPINDRQAIYVRVDDTPQVSVNVRNAAKRANLAMSSGVAYPSAGLAQEVHEILKQIQPHRLYSVLIGALPDPPPGIYIIHEGESAIYVGQTQSSLKKRMAGHRHSQKKLEESAGFIDYVRYRHERSEKWFVRFLPYEQCASLAVQGQLTLDLMNDQEARQLLTQRYIEDPQWGIAQAEAALIAFFRPHFNQEKNTYPHPLQHTDYCEQKCRLCLRALVK